MKSWDPKCKNECEYVRRFEQITEMCCWRDEFINEDNRSKNLSYCVFCHEYRNHMSSMDEMSI